MKETASQQTSTRPHKDGPPKTVTIRGLPVDVMEYLMEQHYTYGFSLNMQIKKIVIDKVRSLESNA